MFKKKELSAEVKAQREMNQLDKKINSLEEMILLVQTESEQYRIKQARRLKDIECDINLAKKEKEIILEKLNNPDTMSPEDAEKIAKEMCKLTESIETKKEKKVNDKKDMA